MIALVCIFAYLLLSRSMTTITVNHQTIHHTVIGAGKPLVLLHGWGANSELVLPLAEALVPKGYVCYAIDLPGFGQSDEPAQPWTVFDYAQWVIAYLDYHQLDEVYLFGHSFGGRLGLILGSEYPNRIIKMALSDAAGIRPPLPIGTQIRLNAYKTIRDSLKRIGAGTIAHKLQTAYTRRYGSVDYQQVSGIMRETFVKVINQDLLDHAKRVSVSTLLFWGDQDQDTPLWMGQQLEKTIPDAGLVIHAGAGHYAYLDKLADTARVMDFFFQQT